MLSYNRRCLHMSLRAVNLVITICGVGMIIYSLWLLQKWHKGTIELPYSLFCSRPWFIYTCLAVGIALCLSTLCGIIVANCFNNSILCIYIASICLLLFLEGAVIANIFFRMDWAAQIDRYIDESHKEFKGFVIFHLKMCRVILITTLILQINSIVLAISLRVVGAESRIQDHFNIPDFRQSFLVTPNSSVPDGSAASFPRREIFVTENTQENHDV
ncbi:tetraspanin-19-like [Quillaja saponaria]|uniref:Tetraspanin-19-like n=1 Tax=Quillaja saponaria TaxID=32244 RepID=A0AAD7LX96_QUISA|nr:tetraspanin-19-like [Quillaja saponaria]